MPECPPNPNICINEPIPHRYLTFDGCLSRDKLVILSHILKTKSLGSAGRHGGATGQQQGLALYGLAIRNHGHLRPDDFLPLLAFFRSSPDEGLSASRSSADLTAMEQQQQQQQQQDGDARGHAEDAHEASNGGGQGGVLSRQPSLLGYVGLRFLDLAGNRLGDAVAADVIRAVSHSPSVTAVDLSGNGIKAGAYLLDAVDAYVKASGGLWLRTLLLDDNALPPKAVVRLVSILATDQSLEVLSLAHNALSDGKPLNESLRALLRRPKGALVELSLAHNRLGTEAARELLFGLLENQALRFLRLRGNPMQAQELDLIERQLAGNRRRFYAPLLGGSRNSNGRAASRVVAAGAGAGGGGGGGGNGGGEDERYDGRGQWAQQQQQRQGQGPAPALEHHRSRSEPPAAAGPDQRSPQAKQPARPPALPEYERVLVDEDGGGIGTGVAGPLALALGGASSSLVSEDGPRARSPLLSVLFSAPLAWRDVNGDLHPIEALFFDQVCG
jgi:hypothetical protein